ncbi:bactofilin family protein [Megalodesulfovibrio paquesii]
MAGKDMINAFLGAGAVFEGQLQFKGMVRIDCSFTGVIHSEGTLILGEKARVEGDINVAHLVSNGTIVGNVAAKGKVTLQKNSRLLGNLVTPFLDVEEGALLEGQVLMKRENANESNIPAPYFDSGSTGELPPQEEESGSGKKKGWFKR